MRNYGSNNDVGATYVNNETCFCGWAQYHHYCLISAPVMHLSRLVSKIAISPDRYKMHN